MFRVRGPFSSNQVSSVYRVWSTCLSRLSFRHSATLNFPCRYTPFRRSKATFMQQLMYEPHHLSSFQLTFTRKFVSQKTFSTYLPECKVLHRLLSISGRNFQLLLLTKLSDHVTVFSVYSVKLSSVLSSLIRFYFVNVIEFNFFLFSITSLLTLCCFIIYSNIILSCNLPSCFLHLFMHCDDARAVSYLDYDARFLHIRFPDTH